MNQTNVIPEIKAVGRMVRPRLTEEEKKKRHTKCEWINKHGDSVNCDALAYVHNGNLCAHHFCIYKTGGNWIKCQSCNAYKLAAGECQNPSCKDYVFVSREELKLRQEAYKEEMGKKIAEQKTAARIAKMKYAEANREEIRQKGAEAVKKLFDMGNFPPKIDNNPPQMPGLPDKGYWVYVVQQ